MTKSQWISMFPAILVFWCVASSVGLIALYPQMGLMAASILVFVVVISLADFFRFSSWAALVLGVGAYFTIYTSMFSFSRSSLIQIGAVAFVYAVAALLSDLYLHQIRSLKEDVSKSQSLMKDLIQYSAALSLGQGLYSDLVGSHAPPGTIV
jgi:hypothetical protein